MNLSKFFLLFASLSGAVAVMLGAFGAHALKAKLAPNLFEAYQTAVQYQFIHTLALLFLALWLQRAGGNILFNTAGVAFVLGLVLFCGSLYFLALGGPRWLGPLTPLGGLCFIVAWLSIFVGALRSL